MRLVKPNGISILFKLSRLVVNKSLDCLPIIYFWLISCYKRSLLNFLHIRKLLYSSLLNLMLRNIGVISNCLH